MSKQIRLVLITLGLLGLIAGMALMLNEMSQDPGRFETWPPNVPTQPCASASVFFDQRFSLDQDLAGAVAVLTQAWRDQGWQVAVNLPANEPSATLRAQQGGQTFEVALTIEQGTFHLVAHGTQRCLAEEQG